MQPMYISIDRKTIRFLHKHPDYITVANLDFVAQRGDTALGPIDSGSLFKEFTDKELSTLYRNTTGDHNIPAVGDSLRLVLMELADRYPVAQVDPAKIEALAAKNESRTDFNAAVLPPEPPIPLTAEEVAGAIRKHTARLHQQAQQRATVRAAATPSPSTPATPVAHKATTGRPQSGVCKRIWEVLDAERAKGDAPSRARIKELCAEHGWNPNTANVQSAAWRRANSLP